MKTMTHSRAARVVLEMAVRIPLVIVFCVSSTGKLASAGTALDLPSSSASITRIATGPVLGIIELSMALLLCVKPAHTLTLISVLASALSFLTVQVIAKLVSSEADCGCFGGVLDVSVNSMLAIDTALVLLSIAMCFIRRIPRLRSANVVVLVIAVVASLGAFFADSSRPRSREELLRAVADRPGFDDGAVIGIIACKCRTCEEEIRRRRLIGQAVVWVIRESEEGSCAEMPQLADSPVVVHDDLWWSLVDSAPPAFYVVHQRKSGRTAAGERGSSELWIESEGGR